VGKLTVGSNPTVSAARPVPDRRGRAVLRRRTTVRAVPHTLPADPEHDTWMGAALAEAAAGAGDGEVPIGAVVVQVGDGAPRIVAARHNEREASGDPTAHAEVLALRDASAALGRWRLDDCILVVTLEPCPMCAGAAWAARLHGVVFGAENVDAGALGTLYHLGQDPRLNHEFAVRGRVRADECATLLRDFFAGRR
jgi:tRNA(adenine34) deaminase